MKSIKALVMAGMIATNLQAGITPSNMRDNEYMWYVDKNAVRVPHYLGELDLIRDEMGFYILKDGTAYPVNYVDPYLMDASMEQLQAFLSPRQLQIRRLSLEEAANLNTDDIHPLSVQQQEYLHAEMNHPRSMGYISVGQMHDGEFTIKANVRGNGGGAFFAWAGYFVVKGSIYAVSYTITAVAGSVTTCFAGPVVGAIVGESVWAALAVPTEIASQAAGTAVALAVGIATGPV